MAYLRSVGLFPAKNNAAPCAWRRTITTPKHMCDRILRPNIPPPLPKWIGVGAQKSLSFAPTRFLNELQSRVESKLLNKNSQLPNSPRSRTELDVGVREEIPEADPDDAPGLVGCRQLVRGGTDVGGGDRFELHRVGVLWRFGRFTSSRGEI